MQARQLNDIISLFKVCGFKSVKLLAQVILIIIGHIGLYKIACKIDSKATKHDSKEKSLRRLLDKSIAAEVYAMFRVGFDFIQHIIAHVSFGNLIPLRQLITTIVGQRVNPNSKLYNIMLNF